MDILPQNGEQCSCAEGRYTAKTGELVAVSIHAHSCEYVRFRNSLIPEAAAIADRLVSRDDRGRRRWVQLFVRHLERLMREPSAGG